jgi:hypothetical protein
MKVKLVLVRIYTLRHAKAYLNAVAVATLGSNNKDFRISRLSNRKATFKSNRSTKMIHTSSRVPVGSLIQLFT